MKFDDKLDLALTLFEWASDWTDPDRLFDDVNCRTFIYRDDNVLHVSEEGDCEVHDKLIYDLIRWNDQDFHSWLSSKSRLYRDMEGDIDQRHEATRVRMQMEEWALIGRLGWYNRKHVLSVWNTDEGQLEDLMPPCIEQCKRDGLVGDNTIVSTPLGNSPARHYQQSEKKELSDEDREHVAMMRELHFMHPTVKKQAMEKLGLRHGGKRSPWADALGPGVRPWKMTSEAYQNSSST